MQIAYTLSMPRNNSWNGKWSGEDRVYAIVRTIRNTQKAQSKAREIIAAGPYFYSWSDGWGAQINVREVTPVEARKLRKQSVGFAGYDWMVNTIESYGKPMADHEVRDHLAKQRVNEMEAVQA